MVEIQEAVHMDTEHLVAVATVVPAMVAVKLVVVMVV